MHALKTYLPVLGRILLSSLFIWAGLGKLTNPAGTAAYFAHAHIPLPDLAVWVAVAIELIGGLMILVGLQIRWVALALAIFCLATGFGVHFQTAMQLPGGAEKIGQMINFYKNLTMAGGFLYVVAFGAGGLSIDRATGMQKD